MLSGKAEIDIVVGAATACASHLPARSLPPQRHRFAAALQGKIFYKRRKPVLRVATGVGHHVEAGRRRRQIQIDVDTGKRG